MKFQRPKGTRDFYPDAMAVRNWIVDRWREVSRRSGFVEFDGPIFESLDLYRVKSGDEIVSELFHFTDRGGREFAIRPEMTPTFARMVAEKAGALARPVKWFSIPRLCRAERPQRGRLREFFQWNIDIAGDDSELADAECIFVAADFFRAIGLSADNVVIKVNSRNLVASILEHAGIAPDRMDGVYAILDKRDKVDADAFAKMVGDLGLDDRQVEVLLTLGDAKGDEGLRRVEELVAGSEAGLAEVHRLKELFQMLDVMSVGHLCRFDMGVVRGLAYYTGTVFEAFGKGGLQRAIAGGGRYDQLIGQMGGPSMPAIGFATSDVVIEDVLAEFDLLPDLTEKADVFVIDADKAHFSHVLSITANLREKGVDTLFSYKRQAMGKQFKQASAKSVRRVIVVDERTESERVVGLKDMNSGAQIDLPLESVLADPFQSLEGQS